MINIWRQWFTIWQFYCKQQATFTWKTICSLRFLLLTSLSLSLSLARSFSVCLFSVAPHSICHTSLPLSSLFFFCSLLPSMSLSLLSFSLSLSFSFSPLFLHPSLLLSLILCLSPFFSQPLFIATRRRLSPVQWWWCGQPAVTGECIAATRSWPPPPCQKHPGAWSPLHCSLKHRARQTERDR